MDYPIKSYRVQEDILKISVGNFINSSIELRRLVYKKPNRMLIDTSIVLYKNC